MRFYRISVKYTLLIGLALWLTACGGGGGGGGSSSPAATESNCIVGSSTLGNCKI